jgi:hypothetical protein
VAEVVVISGAQTRQFAHEQCDIALIGRHRPPRPVRWLCSEALSRVLDRGRVTLTLPAASDQVTRFRHIAGRDDSRCL